MMLRRISMAFVILAAATASHAGATAPQAAETTGAGIQGRIAGDGPDATYYLAVDVEAATVLNRLHTLEYYKAVGEPRMNLGYHVKDLDAALADVRKQVTSLEKSQHIVSVPYNFPVTTVEKKQTVRYDLFPNTPIVFGKGYDATIMKVRVDAGPLKGKELYARRVVDRSHVVVSDRAWLTAPGMKMVAVSENQNAAGRFWKALAKDDKVASAQAYIDGNFTQVPLGTECTIVGMSEDHAFAQVRVTKDGAPRDFWVLATVASLEAPK